MHLFHNPFIAVSTSSPIVMTGSPFSPSGNSKHNLDAMNASSTTSSGTNLPPRLLPVTFCAHDTGASGGSPGGLPFSPTSSICASCTLPLKTLESPDVAVLSITSHTFRLIVIGLISFL
ncbi:unnamed protein product [Microthlaspi erraticum]|uniref:Uncharacterized protein n=1 Tax=Microthlaspi erraticum TaxID=1685480 RepID=A0A6D2J937_9BRAS|nr:unnamed protein product [Microthlaspi erraticum]